jgi:hypothetical protein
MVHSQ